MTKYKSQQTEKVPSTYTFRRGKTGRGSGAARLSWTLVKEIRLWASREGCLLGRSEQTRRLQRAYPLGRATLQELLANRTWYDPAYTPGQVDPTYLGTLGLQALVLKVVLDVARG